MLSRCGTDRGERVAEAYIRQQRAQRLRRVLKLRRQLSPLRLGRMHDAASRHAPAMKTRNKAAVSKQGRNVRMTTSGLLATRPWPAGRAVHCQQVSLWGRSPRAARRSAQSTGTAAGHLSPRRSCRSRLAPPRAAPRRARAAQRPGSAPECRRLFQPSTASAADTFSSTNVCGKASARRAKAASMSCFIQPSIGDVSAVLRRSFAR